MQLTITNHGDVNAWPIITTLGPGTELTVTNMTTGLAWRLTGNIAAGSSLTVDHRPGHKSARLDGANVFGRLADDSALWPLIRPQPPELGALSGTAASSRLAQQACRMNDQGAVPPTGTRQAQPDPYDRPAIRSAAQRPSTWRVSLPTATEAGQRPSTPARLEPDHAVWRSGPVSHLERTVDIDGDMLTARPERHRLQRRNAHPQPGSSAPPYSSTAYDGTWERPPPPPSLADQRRPGRRRLPSAGLLGSRRFRRPATARPAGRTS